MDFLHNQQSDQFLYSFVLPSPQLNEGHPLPSSPPLLWNWNTKNFSLLFQSWFISSNLAFFWTFFIVFMISMMYEYLQFLTFKSESLHANAWRNSEEGRRMLENQGSSSSSFGQETSPTSTIAAGLNTFTSFSSQGQVRGTGLYESNVSSYLPLNTLSTWVSTALYTINRISFVFLLLIYFTFNGYLILSSVLGSAAGYFLFRYNALVYFPSKNRET